MPRNFLPSIHVTRVTGKALSSLSIYSLYCSEEVILAEERTTEEEKHHILEARRRAAAKKKKLKSLGGKNVSTDTEDETEEQGEL
jgi:hypothetical protein